MKKIALVTLVIILGFSFEALAGPTVDRLRTRCGSAARPGEAGACDRDKLRTELAARREQNLERFRKYRLARVYPHNTYGAGMRNVWRDGESHLCAVANMVDKDGLTELVDATAEKANFVRIADVASGPLIDWVLTSGFTQEEIVMIQWPTWAQDDPVGYRMAMAARRAEERARKKEDQRLAKGYLATERALKQKVVRDAGLDLAVARLAARPELVAALHARSTAVTAKK